MKGSRFKNCTCSGLYKENYEENQPDEVINFSNLTKALHIVNADMTQGKCHIDILNRQPICIPFDEAVLFFNIYLDEMKNNKTKYYNTFKYKWNKTLEYLIWLNNKHRTGQ